MQQETATTIDRTESSWTFNGKLLRLIYMLLAVAAANFGRVIAALPDIYPDSTLLSPLFLFGILLMLAGAIVSIIYLVSLTWLLIAYAPQVAQVPPGRMKATTKLLLVFIALNGVAYYALQPNLPVYKSQIVFRDSPRSVQDSMKVLRQLCESINTNEFLSCHVHQWDSTLFFSVPNTRNLIPLTENLGRIDTITASNIGFWYMEKADAVRLLSVIKFLNRNLIAGIVHDTSFLGHWTYPYGMDRYNRHDQWARDLYLYNNPQDTLKPYFKGYFTILDRKEQILLVSHRELQRRLK